MLSRFTPFIACLGLMIHQLQAQKTIQPSIFYIGGGISIPIGLTATVGGYGRQGWGASVTTQNVWPVSQNLPANYNSGDFLGIGGSDKIRDPFFYVSGRVVKVFPTDAQNANLGLELGPSYVSATVADNFVANHEPCGLFGCPPNYFYEEVTKKALGLSLKAKIECLIFSEAASIEFGFNANWNRIAKYYGIDILITLHPLRRN